MYATVATRFAPFTWPMRVATALAVVAIVFLAIRRGWYHRAAPDDLAPNRRGLRLGLVLLAVVGLFQLELYLSSPRSSYPTLSSLASTSFSLWPVRATAYFGWLAAGWYLVDR